MRTSVSPSVGKRLTVPFAWLMLCTLLGQGRAEAQTLPQGFQDTVVFSRLYYPTAVRFSRDGRVFVTEKQGRILVFNGLTDTTPDIVADLSTNVYDYWDRGLLGFALDPGFPTRPYLYILYTYDAEIGGTAPKWNDRCPTPPGPTTDGCVASARLSRLEVSPDNRLVGGEKVLIENNWCQQYPSHSIGDLEFGPDGALYAGAGDSASFTFSDYGQGGGSAGSPTPRNPCGDPPSGVGGTQTPPTAEGGSLRAQDLRTPGDSVTYDGTILRVNPDTGEAWPTNPLAGGDPGDDRIIAYGFRNPFRFTFRPGTRELWIGDVGSSYWDEIDRIPDPEASPPLNFGWPCYEGPNRQPGFDALDLQICEQLYAEAAGSVVFPVYAYKPSDHIDPNGDACGVGNDSITGITFYRGGTYPTSYNGALFFADFSRECLYSMRPGAEGIPDPATRAVFETSAWGAVDLQVGPGGDLFYVEHYGGKIHRVQYFENNQPPVAVIRASPTSGQPPLTVQFDASGSSDPDPGTTLFYRWDLDGDGQFDDAALPTASKTYTQPGRYVVGLQVTDDDGAIDTDQVVITVGNTAPTASILTPAPSLLWRVGDVIEFSGAGSDPEDGPLPAASMHWEIFMHHCPGDALECHLHVIETFDGIDHGSITAPDHEWYSFLELKLTVTDAGGLTDQTSVSVDPEAVTLSFETEPPGLDLVVGSVRQPAPFYRFAIVGSRNSLSAPSPQSPAGQGYYFASWSDGGAQSHEIVAGETPQTYIATYAPCQPEERCDGLDNDCDGSIDEDFTDLGAACVGGTGQCAAPGVKVCSPDGSGTVCNALSGAPTAEICDGLDNDCDGAIDEDFTDLGFVCVSGAGQCAAAGVKVCSADGSGTLCNATPGLPSAEICDGLDNDCNGVIDDAPVPAGSPLLSIDEAQLAWFPVADATAYDIVRGDIDILSSTGGDFTQATLECLANDLRLTSLSYALEPEPGQILWFLVRGVNCGGSGTYDSSGAAPLEGRDDEINASPHSCPGGGVPQTPTGSQLSTQGAKRGLPIRPRP